MPTTGALSFRDDYTQLMGRFQSQWAALEIITDYAIGKFLKVTDGQAHLITSGMMFGRKGRLLADLIGKSDEPKKAAILGAFNKLRGRAKGICLPTRICDQLEIPSLSWNEAQAVNSERKNTH